MINAVFAVPRRYPWPMGLAALTTLWLAATYGFPGEPPFGLDSREHLGVLLGGVISFFVTLGFARLAERKPSWRPRLHLFSALVPAPAVVISVLLMSFDLARSLGLAWGYDPAMQGTVGNVMALHLLAAGTVLAFVLPYASGSVDNDRFVHWSLSSLMAGVVGAAFAGIVLLVLWFSLLETQNVLGFSLCAGKCTGLWSVLAAICYSLIWPWYALSDLPRIDEPGIEATPPPPAPKWLRVTGRGVLLPAWLILAVVTHVEFVRWLLGLPSSMQDSEVALVAVAGGLISVVGYAIAMRDRNQSRIMDLWRRWMGLVLLVPVGAGLYSLTLTQDLKHSASASAVLLSLLVWLLLFGAQTLLRSSPRTPRLATSFIMVMIVGLLAAPVSVPWMVERSNFEPVRRPHVSFSTRSWSDLSVLMQVNPDIYHASTVRLTAHSNDWRGHVFTPLAGTDFPAPLSVRLTSNRIYVQIASCPIAEADVVPTLLGAGGELPSKSSPLILAGQSAFLSISLNVARVRLLLEDSTSMVLELEGELFLQRLGARWPDLSSCPEPIRLERRFLKDGTHAILPSRSPS